MDAGLGRETSTSNNYLLKVKRNIIKYKYIVKDPAYSSLGPHLVKDLLEIGPEVDMLMWSLDPGRLSIFA